MSDVEQNILTAFEQIRLSEKEMDDLNEEELKTSRNIIKDIRGTKNSLLNEWVNTDLKRYGRLTKHDLLRILIGYRMNALLIDTKGGKL